jgi:hypothetical protein
MDYGGQKKQTRLNRVENAIAMLEMGVKTPGREGATGEVKTRLKGRAHAFDTG